MKKSIDIPSADTRTILIFGAMIVIFCISFLCIGLYETYIIDNETRIIKIKYAGEGFITDNCGHPEIYRGTRYDVDINEIYEITITSYRNNNRYITYIKSVDKEKYIEKC
jgi:hypothetical protein